eukprot:11842570-Alexandrium_andersonii.AAC.1
MRRVERSSASSAPRLKTLMSCPLPEGLSEDTRMHACSCTTCTIETGLTARAVLSAMHGTLLVTCSRSGCADATTKGRTPGARNGFAPTWASGASPVLGGTAVGESKAATPAAVPVPGGKSG